MDKYTITITSDKPISIKVTEAAVPVADGLKRLSEEIRNAGGKADANKPLKALAENR